MTETPAPSSHSPATYADGQPYSPPAGRTAPRPAITDHSAPSLSVVTGKPDTDTFVRLIRREMKIRFYTQDTVRNYLTAIQRFLNWTGR